MTDSEAKLRELEQEEEVIPAIRLDDAEWKIIQQNTFTRWVNNHLKKAGDSIQSLEKDFANGLKLINLAAVLSRKNVGKYNKKVNFRSQKLENVSLALKFFQDVEHIKIVNIDSSHIVDQNKKLILGLIWTLILHYSISMGWIAERRDGQSEDTPKQKLLNWIRGKLPNGMPLTNFTSDWNDGIALGALVNSLVPDSVPNWDQWTPNDALVNTQTAMQIAQNKLGIEPLIKPAELIHPEIDEMSVMTYLSQFPTAKLIHPPKLPSEHSGSFREVDESPIINIPTEFTINLTGDGYKPELFICDFDGNNLYHTIVMQSPNSFTVKYTPERIGPHKLVLGIKDVVTGDITFAKENERKIQVLPAARLCTYTEQVKIGDQVSFRIEDAYNGLAEIVVVDGTGSEEKLVATEGSDGTYECIYVPENLGLHSINVFHRKLHVQGSPFPLKVVERNAFIVWGRGISDKGIRIGDKVPVYIQSKESLSTDDIVKVQVIRDDGSYLHVRSLADEDRFAFEYTPLNSGEYEVHVMYNRRHIGQSPYKVNVLPMTSSLVRAFGPGLEGGMAEHQSIFTVETNGETDILAFSIEGPSKTEIACQNRSQSVALVAYTPKEPGIYKVNVLSGGEHIQASPFVVMVDSFNPLFHPSAVQVSGLNSNLNYFVGDNIAFNVHTTLSGVCEIPQVNVLDKDLNPVPVRVHEMTSGNYGCEFIPRQIGKHHVNINLKGVAVPGSPFPVNIREPVDVSKLCIYGPGVEGPVICREPTHFTIDAKQAGPGAVEVALADRNGCAVDIDVLDNNDGSFTVKYTAPRPGAYQLNVVFAGEEIPPIAINVKPRVDLSGIRVEGLENDDVLVGHRVNLRVNTDGQVSLGQGLKFICEVNSKQYTVPLISRIPNIHEGFFTLSELGRVKMQVYVDENLVRQAMFNVLPGQNALKCKANGFDLNSAIVGKPTSFSIDTHGAGDGGLYLEISGPAEAVSTIRDMGDRTYTVEYVPPVIGIYSIGVMFGEDKKHIPGSPFNTAVDYPYIPSKIQVIGLKSDVSIGQPINFCVDASQTKEALIAVRVPPIYQQPLLEQDSSRIYKVHFTPVGDPGDIIPIEVFYDGKPINNSPFMLTLLPEVEPNKIRFTDTAGREPNDVIASMDAIIVVDASNCGNVSSVRAEVVGPDGNSRECTLSAFPSDDKFELRWSTDVIGDYFAKVYVNGIKADQEVKVHAKELVGKTEIDRTNNLLRSDIILGEKRSISYVRHEEAKMLHLAVIAKVPDAVEFCVESEPFFSGRVRDIIHFRPTKLGQNMLQLYYGGKNVDNIEYTAVSADQLCTIPADLIEQFEKRYYNNNIAEKSESEAFFTREFKFNFDPSLVNSQLLKAFVTMPSKQTDQAEIIDNHDGTVLVKYTPKKIGFHELSIVQDGAQIKGTPVRFFVDSYHDGFATIYGPGLQNSTVGEPAAFTVCAKGSHAKELSVSIEGPAQSTIQIHDNKDGTCSVTWVPPVPGEYKVHVKLGAKEVRDSPFTVLVAGEGQKRAHLSVGSTSEVALNIAQSELKGISASIKSPSGIEEPCFVRLIEGGRLGVSFTPREAGEHLITVKRDGKLVPKAPFKIKVDKSQVGDASKVEVSGGGKSKAICMQDNEILIDTSKAGYGGLSVSVQGPSKAELACKEVKVGLIKVNYKPTEPGVYVIAIKFADHHVKDSPLTVQCTGKGAGRVQQLISRKAEQAPLSLPNQEATLFLKLPNASPMDINARIMDPKGRTEDVEMRDLGDSYYQIKFRPEVEGAHALSVMHKDAHVNGSPFQFTVGQFSEGGAHKVRASGMGVIRGETNHKQIFNVYTREAGPGNLAVTMEGPSKAILEFKDHKDGNCHVEYKVSTPGEYIVSVKFNDTHIPDSPFKVFIAPAVGEARKLELAQFHDQGIPAGKAFTFTVLTHRARGHLEAKVVSPNNEVDTIDIVPIEDGESYALRFVPKETGNHYIHVTLDGAPMRDSPFRLRVGGKDMCDPTAISASGDGLKKGQTGQKCEFVITTSNAGAGILNVQLDGPSKATLDAYELDRGYKVRYTPLAPGDYYAAIKYNGIHIPGSPFKIPIEGKVLGGNGYNETSIVKIDAVAKTSKGTVATIPEYKGDASKVVAKGAGLNKFFPGRPAMFTIDTGLAGTNLLMVAVVTTKGPCEEVLVKHQGNGHYIVNYKVPDRVKGFVFIKYGTEEIPGSPFAIEP